MKSHEIEDKASARVCEHLKEHGPSPEPIVSGDSSLIHSSASSTPRSDQQEQQQEVVQALTFQTLARQLEYYFSTQNLQTDTYLQTLRDLNDGCVPVNILANFSKVKSILTPHHVQTPPRSVLLREEQERILKIQACLESYSTLLQVFHLDPTTGRRVPTPTANSIVVVGPTRGDILPTVSSTAPKLYQSSYETECANVIILRDVAPTVTEEQVQALFDSIDGCPNILNIVSDVAHHWFITLDTDDRTQSMRVMMQLQTMQFPNGDYVMARLRASVITAPVDVYSTLPASPICHQAPRKKKRRSRKKKSRQSTGVVDKSMPEKPSKRTQEPPRLTADHFPTLQDERVEWETATPGILSRQDTLEDDSRSDDDKSSSTYSETDGRKSTRPYSDVASTATTTSSTATGTSSSLSGTDHLPKNTGYAAALLKNVSSTTADIPRGEPDTSSSDAEVREITNALSSASINEKPISWGSQQSFADIVRSDQP